MPPESASTPAVLLGRWIPDAAAAGTAPFVELEFRKDGKLRYALKGEGLDESLLLDYRTEGHTIVTRQPGAQSDVKTRFELGNDGSLTLEYGGKKGRYVRAN